MYRDLLVGSNVANYLSGQDGSDATWAGAGSDTVLGASGYDRIDGGPGEDWLHGGRGNDTVSGGADGDTDTFVFEAGDGADVILDFEDDIDVLDLDLAGLGYTSVDDLYANATITEVNGDTLLDFGTDGSILVLGITPDALRDDII